MALLKREKILLYTLIVLLSTGGLIFCLISTSLFGAGLSPDSVQYIATARNLLAGKLFVAMNDTPMVAWPPLFPILLAAVGFIIDLDPLDAARFVNAIAFGLTVGAGGCWFYSHFQTKVIALCGTLAILLAVPLLNSASVALTETVFALLVVLFLIFVPKALSGKKTDLLVLILITALCCLQRYMGVAVLFTGLIILLSRCNRTSLRQKIKMAGIYGIGSSLPLALWILHNYLLTGTPTGPRSPGTSSIFANLLTITYIIFNWFLPLNLLETWQIFFIGSLICLSIILLGGRLGYSGEII